MNCMKTTLLAVMLCTARSVFSAEPFVTFSPQPASLSLRQAAICLSADEPKAVRIAVGNLQEDLLKVTGQKPIVCYGKTNNATMLAAGGNHGKTGGGNVGTADGSGRPDDGSGVAQDGSGHETSIAVGTGQDGSGHVTTIAVGTVGYSKWVDELVRKGTLRDLKGRREKFIVTTVEGQVVIAGSDRRGTVYGIYEVSKQIGVSPWYWWMDAPVRKREYVGIVPGEYSDGEPAVEFRGLFLNDEAPCLTTWVKNTWGTEYGDHRFYGKVFELILRLKGNMLWPAMWGWAFYADDAENLRTADDMGVIMGTSHHEAMARNHQEYARRRGEWGPWNYEKNAERLNEFFREGIERMKGTEDMVTIGMRGDGDEAMSEDADTRLLERIVKEQRRIIKEVTGKPANRTTQVWALYKEVQDYYDKGMRVPDDVIMLLCDDNWGNVRRLPTAKERQHPGGWGLYYHVDYVGAPRNSKWLNVTPSQNMWEQLTMAYEGGIRRMWILNVGDLKPMEYPITLFMDMAWRPDSVGPDVVATHTREFCRQVLGEDRECGVDGTGNTTGTANGTDGTWGGQAREAARLLNLCCKMNGRITAEMLDCHTYNVRTGEWRQVADEYMRLEAEALRQYVTLRPEQRDVYRELILFPVQAMSNVYQMYYAQAMNWSLYEAGDPDCNVWAERVEECFLRDAELCRSYNKELAGGKWDGMMTQKHIGYTSWNDDFAADRMPEVKRMADCTPGGFVFQGERGYVAMEAEHFYSCTPAVDGTAPAGGSAEEAAADARRWTVIPDMGRTRSGVVLTPYGAGTEGARLEYRFRTERVREVRVHVVVKSTLDYLNKGGLTYTVSLDGREATVNFNGNLNEQKENIYSIYYPTVARRVVESVVTLPMDEAVETHSLTLHPNDGGIVFEKVVVDAGGYEPSYLFMDESPRCRGLASPRS